MEQKKEPRANKVQAKRILYIVIAGVLCVSAAITGIALTMSDRTTSDPGQTTPIYQNDDPTDPVGNVEDENKLPVFVSPITGMVSRLHDLTTPVFSQTLGEWRVHRGMDITAAPGTAVLAAADGVISDVYDDPMLGKCVLISHKGNADTLYANLNAELPQGIAKGAAVTAGQTIGAVGDTAMSEMADEAHLHFEMKVDGKEVNPLDYLSSESREASLSSADENYEG